MLGSVQVLNRGQIIECHNNQSSLMCGAVCEMKKTADYV